MPTYSYRCDACGSKFDELKPMAERAEAQCECGATAKQRITPVRFDTLRMGAGSDMPTFVDKFDRMHREQAAKEEKHYREHGDYGPAPGAD